MGTAVDAAFKGNYGKAIDILKRLIDIKPDLFDAKELLGKIYARQGRYEEAIQKWLEVLKEEPNNYEITKEIRRAESLRAVRDSGGFYKVNSQKRLFIGISIVLLFSLIAGYLIIPVISNPQPKEIVYRIEKMEIKNLTETLKQKMESHEIPKNMLIIDTKKIDDVMKKDNEISFLSLKLRAEEDKLFVYGKIPTLYLYERVVEFLRGFSEIKAIDTTGVRITGIYVVREGENLASISKKLYGNSQRWREIFKRNNRKINSPKRIYNEMELKVPLM
jgi:tetratricopeptide (TPR) repeat protein